MTLAKELSPNIVYKSVLTESEGKFVFSQLIPGNYVLRASHPTWVLDAPSQKVTFSTSQTIATQIFVLGYKVTGEVSSNNHPMSGVSVFLYSDNPVPKTPLGCATVNSGPITGKTPICEVISNASGKYEFLGLPAGKFLFVPYYRGFTLAPEESEITLDGSNTQLVPFVVKGFVVHGTVVNTLKQGVSDVVILVNGKEMATTNEMGDYSLDGISSGKYNLEAQKEHMMFTKLRDIEILPSSPRIPAIMVSHLDICGQVTVKDFSLVREISLKADNAPEQMTTTNKQGKFCFKAGVTTKGYTVKAVITSSEASQGLVFKPEFIQISLEHAPVLGLKFEQVLFGISGKIKCKSTPCESVAIQFVSKNDKIEKMVENSFEFGPLLAGKYQISVSHSNWCWIKSTQEVVLDKVQNVEISFEQSGFNIEVDSSQDVTLRLKEYGSEVLVKAGIKKYCVGKPPGVYHLIPSSCFVFDQSEYRIDSTNHGSVKLVVVGSQIQGVIRTKSESKSGITVVIDDDETIQATYVGILVYEYKFIAKSNKPTKIKPSSKSHIFVPESQTVQMTSTKCVSAQDFIAREGIFISGNVKPNIENAQILVKKGGSVVLQSKTDSKGLWTVGPLYDDEEYEIDCVMEGYQVLRKSKTEFYLTKYSWLTIQVTDQDSQPLSGVFLSLTGEGFRNNSITENGVKTFSQLSAGNFYLKTMLKEYVFTPETTSFELLDGESKTITIKGRRTAYSAFGSVVSINKIPIVGAIVQAIGKNGEYEEGFTDASGNYRIRGLETKEYVISLKKGDMIERSHPAQISIKMETRDSLNHHFMAFRPNKKVIISGFVSVDAPNAKDIQIELLTGMDADRAKVVKKVHLGVNNFFIFSNLAKESVNYFVRIKSDFDPNFYTEVAPVVQAIPNGNTFIEFSPKLKEKDYGQENFYGILFAVLVFIVSMNWNQLTKIFGK